MLKMNAYKTLVRATTIALGLALTLFILPTASAQEERHPPRDRGDRHAPPSAEEREQMMQERMSRMQEALQLTDEQVSQLQPILAEQDRKMHALRQEGRGGQGDREGLRATMQELHKSTNAQVAAVLNDEQFKQYREHQQRQRQARGEGRGPRGGGHEGGHRGPPPPDDRPE